MRGSGEGPGGGGPITDEDRGTAIAARIDADLLAAARGPARRPHEPELRRTAGGGYRYEGTQINADIHPDGSVEFQDNPITDLHPAASTDPDTGQVIAIGFGFRFPGLTEAALAAAGQDPYRGERAWFMERTQALRDRLEDEHRAQLRRAGRADLERRLEDLWRGGGSPTARRRGIFALWEECAEDGIGAEGRGLIERWVRRHLPTGSARAYPPAELEALNRGRDRIFAPYQE